MGESISGLSLHLQATVFKPSQRKASVSAKAKIRDLLVSHQDRKDNGGNGGNTRRDTPQVSPSIPLNPDTPNGAWQMPFVPTNDLVLTRPAVHQNDDETLADMLRRFESTAALAAAIRAPQLGIGQRARQMGINQQMGSGSVPSRRSFLRPAPRPASVIQSAYPPPPYQTWRKFPDTPTEPAREFNEPAPTPNTPTAPAQEPTPAPAPAQ